MKKIIIVCFIFSIVYLTNIFGQGKAVTNTAEITGDTKEAKTIKVVEQAPGVITEDKEDGTKVVTINLSEVDENKLPEKYEAEVILETPIYTDDYIYENKEKLKGQIYFMEAVDAAERINFDVSIDEIGNIYIYDPYMSRIQKFNNKGKHIKNIPIKEVSEGYYDKKIGRLVHKSLKTNIVAEKGKIYVRDIAKNHIEAIDESGTVLETIDIPEKIDGKDTREMKMWADEEGVGVGDEKRRFKFENKKVKILDKHNSDNFIKWSSGKKESIFQTKIKVESYFINIKTKKELFSIDTIGFDGYGNQFLQVYTKEKITDRRWKVWDKILKINNKGKLLAVFEIEPYWFSNEWKAGCDSISPLIDNWEVSRKIQKNGDVFLLQYINCKKQDYIGKIRIIKLSSRKGK